MDWWALGRELAIDVIVYLEVILLLGCHRALRMDWFGEFYGGNSDEVR